MSTTTITQKECEDCCYIYEKSSFYKCQFCGNDFIFCIDCLQNHFVHGHFEPIPINDKEFEELEDL